MSQYYQPLEFGLTLSLRMGAHFLQLTTFVHRAALICMIRENIPGKFRVFKSHYHRSTNRPTADS